MENKEYFLPGDVVTIRQEVDNKPQMIVMKKATKRIKMKGVFNDVFQGIVCRWFTKNLELQEATFNTKDLKKIK